MSSRPPAGVPIDYASPRTGRPPGRPWLASPPPGRVTAEIGVILLVCTLFAEAEFAIAQLAVMACAFIAVVLGRYLIRAVRRPDGEDELNRRWWRRTCWICVGLVALSLRYDACPHARYLCIGFVPVTIDGTRCGNVRHFRNGPQIAWDWVVN